MDFKRLFSAKVLIPSLVTLFIVGLILNRFVSKADSSSMDNVEAPAPVDSIKNVVVQNTIPVAAPELDASKDEDVDIQQQLDRDRQEQRQTKYLKSKLEQTDLELEQEKDLAEINKLKMENMGNFKDPAIDGQKNIPEIRVEYIGGDSVKKEAILSIAGVNFQVKEQSNPTDNIQVLSISDSSVTVHVSAPQELTKTIDYKPE